MGTFIDQINARIKNEASITIEELAALEELVLKKMTGFKLQKAKERKNQGVEIGKNCEVPLNPFTGFEYPLETYEELWDYFCDNGSSGQFASQKQWNDNGRKCNGAPVSVKKIYGKVIPFFAYEQTQ